MTIYDEPQYGIINENCSRLFPGAKVLVLKYLESVDQYEVKNEKSDLTYWVKSDGIELL